MHIILYIGPTVLYCTALHCSALYCTALYSTLHYMPTTLHYTILYRGGSRIFERGGGSILGLQAKKGGSRRGYNFRPNVKNPILWPQKGGPGPLDPPPPDPPMLYYTTLHYTLLCYTTLRYTILYYTTLYIDLLYYTIYGVLHVGQVKVAGLSPFWSSSIMECDGHV